MNPSNLRPFPAPTADATAAERELASLFDGLLARGAGDEESPDFELLEAAVDGGLDAVEAEMFASRLVGDPGLQREFDELVALRERFAEAPAARRTAPATVPSRAAGHRWLGLAAAAVVLMVAGLGLRQHSLPQRAPGASGPRIAAQAPHPAQPLFADSFEAGTTDRWSN